MECRPRSSVLRPTAPEASGTDSVRHEFQSYVPDWGLGSGPLTLPKNHMQRCLFWELSRPAFRAYQLSLDPSHKSRD